MAQLPSRHFCCVNLYLITFVSCLVTLVNVYVDLLVLRVLPVLHRPEVVDIGVKSYIEKTCHMAKGL